MIAGHLDQFPVQREWGSLKVVGADLGDRVVEGLFIFGVGNRGLSGNLAISNGLRNSEVCTKAFGAFCWLHQKP